MRYCALLLLTLCACEPRVTEDIQYRCHDVDPGLVWAAAYGAAHTESNPFARYTAVQAANKAVEDWEDHCVIVTGKIVGGGQ